MNFTAFWKKTPIVIVRFGIGVIPIVWIFRSIDWPRMWQAVHAIAWWTAPLLFCTIISSMLLQGIRWWMLMTPFSPSLSFYKSMRAHFLGLYYSIILPTSAAQDAVRAGILSKEAGYSLSWASTWVSRLIGLFVLALMSLYGLFGINRSMLPPLVIQSALAAFLGIAALLLLSFSKRFTAPMRSALGKFVPKKIMEVTENIRESVFKYRGRWKELFWVFMVTLALQLIITVGAAIVILGISGRFLFFESLLYLPIIEVLCMSIPVTPNGIGLREGMLALMFKQVGLTTEHLAIFIVLGYFSISLKLLGGLPLAVEALTRTKRNK